MKHENAPMGAESAAILITEIVDHFVEIGFTARYKDALEAGITALRRPTWVSVADRLPEDSEDVLVWGLNQSGAGNYYNAYFNASDEVWYFDDCAPVSVTHWMSLPNEPEVDA